MIDRRKRLPPANYRAISASRPSTDDLAPSLARALASGLPAVIDCLTGLRAASMHAAFRPDDRYGFDALTRL